MKPYIALAGAGIAWGLTIALLSAAPVERVHLMEYGLVGILAYRAMGHRFSDFEQAALSGLICLNAGFLDESIQGIVPGRYYDSNDVFVNFIAASCGVILAAAWPRKS